MNDWDQGQIDTFFSTISPWTLAYQNLRFSYVAFLANDSFVLAHSRLFLNTGRNSKSQMRFASEHIRAVHISLKTLKASPRELTDRLLNGHLIIQKEKLLFPGEAGRYAATFLPFHQLGLARAARCGVLTIKGARNVPQFGQLQIDWELKAATTPYDSLSELLRDYLLDPLPSDGAVNFEIWANEVAAIDFQSTVNGSVAKLGVYLGRGLDPKMCRIGYSIFHQQKVRTRSFLGGAKLTWKSKGQAQHGVGEIRIPQGAVLHCFACYAGSAQHHYWLTDPHTAQNPRRAVLMEFDNEEMATLRDFLADAQRKGRNARDLEFGVAWLFWLLGFAVAHLGANARTQDAPDLIATTPQGNFAVVECTTGILKADNKLPRVAERTEALRRRLNNSGHSHLRLLPVLVTTKGREDIKGELEQAKQSGVAVVTGEMLAEAINQTIVASDPEKIFDGLVRLLD